MTSTTIDVKITGSLNDPDAAFSGAFADITGCMDFSGVRGPVDVTMRLDTQLPLQFTGLLTSDSPFQRPKPHPAGDPGGQFRQVAVQPRAITFDYRNANGRPYNIYALVLTDNAGRQLVLDPYIKNGMA